MCMLTVFPMPELLTADIVARLHNGAAYNNDGHGFAVVCGDRIRTGRNMSADMAIDSFADAYRNATGPALFHSRFTTHGTTDLANVHPFRVRKLASTYVAHNGILPDDAHPAGKDKRSDTRLFADDILGQRYSHLDDARTRADLAAWLGASNKIAILTTNKRLSRQLYLFGMSRGDWVNGVWFSNSDHEGYGRWRWAAAEAFPATTDKRTGKAGESWPDWRGAEELCTYCPGIYAGRVLSAGYCDSCRACADCGGDWVESCQCYAPKGAR